MSDKTNVIFYEKHGDIYVRDASGNERRATAADIRQHKILPGLGLSVQTIKIDRLEPQEVRVVSDFEVSIPRKGSYVLYKKADGQIYRRDDDGVERLAVPADFSGMLKPPEVYSGTNFVTASNNIIFGNVSQFSPPPAFKKLHVDTPVDEIVATSEVKSGETLRYTLTQHQERLHAVERHQGFLTIALVFLLILRLVNFLFDLKGKPQ